MTTALQENTADEAPVALPPFIVRGIARRVEEAITGRYARPIAEGIDARDARGKMGRAKWRSLSPADRETQVRAVLSAKFRREAEADARAIAAKHAAERAERAASMPPAIPARYTVPCGNVDCVRRVGAKGSRPQLRYCKAHKRRATRRSPAPCESTL